MASAPASVFRSIGLGSTKQSMLMLVLVWILNVAWLGLNYFWRIASVNVLLAILILFLAYAVAALAAYIYWGVRDVKEQETPYANLMVGVIVAITLLYFNFELLQIVLNALQR
ncbi:CHASE2 domain-containing sensor protein [Pontibacter aydingkolensis]|uniref:Uncharacterized protein n=1 Tax=Pontibacter aydingkolensis TaxID=1911536 RepID=A0ABS7CPE7_9BACT|nr:hypothetical protein [Pontibacter aydingkolensis]MBW7465708.1 hypothetical protein [Pontibacter aydingkolensis]